MDNDVLRQTPLFSGLDDNAADSLRTSLIETRLRRGEILFREGDSGDRLYVVIDGKMKLDIGPLSGEEVQTMVGQLFAMPKRVVERAKQALVYKPPAR